jgi:hypothetical protein
VPSRPHDFKPDDVRRALLWCARHCCLCSKQCGVGIELAHIVQDGSNAFDNGIPVCFDCHLAIGGYDRLHPRGRKLGEKELKARREQVYERHTRHLVPSVQYQVTQNVMVEKRVAHRRTLPDVGFLIKHTEGLFPVRAKVKIQLWQDRRKLSVLGPHYDGSYVWNLNPGFGVNGHFELGKEVLRRKIPVRAAVDVTLIDIHDRPHPLLQIGFVHRLDEGADWYLEPSPDALKT